MKYIKTYKIFESTEAFEPGVDLEYIDLFLEDIADKGYTINQYFGFKDRADDKVSIVDRRYIDNLISDSSIRVHRNVEIYQDYLNGDMSYIIKIYSYMEEKGYTDDFPFGEITYSDIYGPLKQLIGYMSEERGLSYYKIFATTDAHRDNVAAPWDYTFREFSNIEDVKDVKIIGALSLHISKNKEFLPKTKI